MRENFTHGLVNEVKPMRPWRRGFTLIELLVVVAIIAILASLLLPALTKAREMAKRSNCLSSIKQMGLSCALYADQSEDFFPTGSYTASISHNTFSGSQFLALSGQAWPGGPRIYALGALLMSGVATFDDVWCPEFVDQAQTKKSKKSYWLNEAMANKWYSGGGGRYYEAGYDYRTEGSTYTTRYVSPSRDPNLVAKPIAWDNVTGRIWAATGSMRRFGHQDGYNALYGDLSGRWLPDPGWASMQRWDSDTNYYWGTNRDRFVVNFLDKN